MLAVDTVELDCAGDQNLEQPHVPWSYFDVIVPDPVPVEEVQRLAASGQLSQLQSPPVFHEILKMVACLTFRCGLNFSNFSPRRGTTRFMIFVPSALIGTRVLVKDQGEREAWELLSHLLADTHGSEDWGILTLNIGAPPVAAH